MKICLHVFDIKIEAAFKKKAMQSDAAGSQSRDVSQEGANGKQRVFG